jgi:hypothetical protein
MLSFCAPQEVVKPDVFWYDAPTKIDLPFNIVGLLAFEFFAMHFVELKRWQDFRNPGSVDADPLFPSNKLKPHEVCDFGCVTLDVWIACCTTFWVWPYICCSCLTCAPATS